MIDDNSVMTIDILDPRCGNVIRLAAPSAPYEVLEQMAATAYGCPCPWCHGATAIASDPARLPLSGKCWCSSR